MPTSEGRPPAGSLGTLLAPEDNWLLFELRTGDSYSPVPSPVLEVLPSSFCTWSYHLESPEPVSLWDLKAPPRNTVIGGNILECREPSSSGVCQPLSKCVLPNGNLHFLEIWTRPVCLTECCLHPNELRV